jgi:hypothetical protein
VVNFLSHDLDTSIGRYPHFVKACSEEKLFASLHFSSVFHRHYFPILWPVSARLINEYVASSVDEMLTGRDRSNQEKNLSTSPNANPTWPALGLNLDLRDERPANNSRRCSTV